MRWKTLSACSVFVLSLMSAEARAQRRYPGFSDQAVEQAIKKAVQSLVAKRQADGSWGGHGGNQGGYPVGPTALVAYALLESGISPQDPGMARTLEWLATNESIKTYSLGIRANVWLTADRYSPGKYMNVLRKDVIVLCNSTGKGAYRYVSKGLGQSDKGSFDNSNSQYGVLGAWAGARGLIEVPRQYWYLVLKHWLSCQNTDGGWDYTRRGSSTHTMTAAGVATLFVCFDNLFAEAFIKCNLGESMELKAINRGLEWFDRNFEKTLGQGRLYYYLYGVERVGLACGYKYFGTADWYKLGATTLTKRQNANGMWGSIVDTSFALLFLIRGQNPVLFNKLEFAGDWNNRPRDLATLTRWISRTFEATVNWQIINLKVPVEEWHDAPIIYLSASKAPQFTDQDLDKLRTFVHQGGTLFSCTECSGSGFRAGIRTVYRKLFPKYELTPAGPTHELYSVHFPLKGRPRFHTITNGVRPLVIHTDEDLPVAWQRRQLAVMRNAFEAAANVFMYVTDKGSLRHRGVSLWPSEPTFSPQRAVTVARLEHSGNFDPEPLAYERFARLMGQQTQTRVNVVGPVAIAALPGSGARVATLTGTGAFKLTDQEQTVLKEFVTGGGTLVVDAAGGSKPFAEAAEEALAAMFGVGSLRRLSSTSPLYALPGMEIKEVRYRRRTRRKLGRTHMPNLRAVLIGDRAGVIFSREDLTAGLVGYPSYTCDGYDPESAYEIMRNIVVSAAEKVTSPEKPRPQPASKGAKGKGRSKKAKAKKR